MKKIALPLVLLFLLAIAAVSFLNSSAGFDFLQKVKYPEYYSWKAGAETFPENKFWIGFNTDRHRKDFFIGRTREDIARHLPLISAVASDDGQLNSYISGRHLPPTRFAQINGSSWLLEFDSDGHCIDLILAKG